MQSAITERLFVLRSGWLGGRRGQGWVRAAKLSAEVSIPVELGGPGDGTNPEELVLGAAASCYLITLASQLERRGLAHAGIEVVSEALVTRRERLELTQIVHEVTINAGDGTTTSDRAAMHEMAISAEQSCMISRALSGNVRTVVRAVVAHNAGVTHG
jgi:peroxiredoxin-like protein